ncbi:MAG TPA: nuclear transport factor 2 family protein [Thermomicrobiales bacterium]|nr:nuclear transport factor 2 family protein [Thermomicrobiales bacterium]
MEPNSPEAWWPLFQQAMRAGDVAAALRLYEEDAAFANAAGVVRLGHADLRAELGPMAEAKAVFRVTVNKIIQAGDLALIQTEWSIEQPEPRSGYALEVLRRQADGRWLLAIGDPFTVGRWSQERDAARRP